MAHSTSRAHVLLAIAVVAGFAAAGCGIADNPASPSSLTAAQVNATETSARTGATIAPAAASHEVPFKGRLEGTYALSFPGPMQLAVTGEGSGNATQLGQFAFAYDELVDLTSGTGAGTYVLTAANDDRLIATWTGLGFPTSDPNVLAIVEYATITGGTGRFADAGGSFTVNRLFNFTTNSGAGSLEGAIHLR